MATRASMEQFMQQCKETIQFAEEQFENSNKQQHYNGEDYQMALQQLENAYNDLAQLAHSSNSQQREQLHRMRLQLQQLQNQMILHNYY